MLKETDSVKPDQCSILHPDSKLRDIVDDFLITKDPAMLQQYLISILLTQMYARAGIKKHGDKLKEVLFTEFLQLHDMGVFWPIHRDNLTKKQIERALRALSVIKEK